ncbi:ubiquitin-like-specific protease 1A [Olea europaea var. sylvestris]|uniref:ubiquitin-like-specific protease 1A n=1 Tax=Olea europaea var. sylvestris TaxID=158386 RepID=UPI000C1D14D1|nr:ubiquitin-like-specific protease 1A [Olea europaea var. sylvestris]
MPYGFAPATPTRSRKLSGRCSSHSIKCTCSACIYIYGLSFRYLQTSFILLNPRSHFVYYSQLISGRGGYNFQSVRRWTTQKKLGYSLLECDKIFVPIHKEVHWCLAIINKKDQKFQYLDSLKGVDAKAMKVLAKYLVDEVKDKSGMDIDVNSWEQEYVVNLPEQENG